MTSSITPLRASHAADESVELLREIRDLLRSMVADQRAAAPALIAALAEHYGPARFTTNSVLQVCAEDPHSALAEAVSMIVDMNASPRSRATSLGAWLARQREIEVVAEQRGASIYKLAF